MINVLMIGAARDVRGGVSSVVNGYYSAGLDKKINLKYLPTMKDGSKLKKLFVAIQARISFGKLIKDADILHVHLSNDASFYRKRLFILDAKKKNKKILIHLHGSTFDKFYLDRCNKRQKEMVREVFEIADKVIALSKDWKEFIDNNLITKSTDTDKVIVIYNAVPIPGKINKDYGNRNILFLGKMGNRKGTYDLINVCEKLLPKYPDLQLYLGGDGETENVKQIINSGPLKNNAHYIGWVRGQEKEKYLRNSSIFALPSYNEGMPMSVLEAMSYGCSVISTYVGGIPHIIDNNNTGILVNAGNRHELEAGLDRLLSEEALRKELGESGARTIKNSFDINVTCNQVLKIYEELNVI